MTSSAKIASAGPSRLSPVANPDPEPTVLAYRRPAAGARSTSAAGATAAPSIILRIPDLRAELPGSTPAKPILSAPGNKAFWGFGVAGIVIIMLLSLTEKKPERVRDVQSPQQAHPQQTGAPAPLAPLPGGQGLTTHQAVPAYREQHPHAVAGRMTPLAEPADLSPTAPAMPSAPAPDPQSITPNGPRPSDQFMGPPQHVFPWRQDAPPPVEFGPQLAPPDRPPGWNAPEQSPFTLPEQDPRSDIGPQFNQDAQTLSGDRYQRGPALPEYRTAALSEAAGREAAAGGTRPGASFEGVIVKPTLEGQYDRSRPRPY